MTLRMEQVLAVLPAVVAGYAGREAALDEALRRAEGLAAGWAADPAAGDAAIQRAMQGNPAPFAISAGEPLMAAFDAPPLGPLTVVAADGSSIEPDRFAAVQCYVINVGEVVLPYGHPGEALLRSRALVGPTAGAADSVTDGARGWAVTLRRDVMELEAAAGLAWLRREDGDVVMLLDGTLLPWDLDSRQVPPDVRKEMEDRTRDALALVQTAGPGVSAGAYVSASRAGDVMTSLAALSPVDSDPMPPADALLFGRLLQDGQRSALFAAQSSLEGRVEQRFAPAHRVHFFYMRSGDDIARVELPHWAGGAAAVGRLHAALVDQCRRCGGYPRALQEAHEQAVISGADREQFSRLLESEAARHAIRTPGNGKQMSKRRRAL